MSSDLPDLGDRFVIDATIGTGGMATVARGHDRSTGASVALKRLHDHLAGDPHFEKIIRDEARLQTLVRHPNVVATLAVGLMDGRVTLVLELVEGSSLARLVRARDRLDPDVVVEIGCQMLAGLGAAHAATDEAGAALDLVHRDVSPQNVLVDRTGAVKLADFGVARARSRLQTTTEGRIKGKLAYMSPEQIEGHPLDARSDLFSTGVVLWELVTGMRLFQGESEGEVVRKVLSQPIPRPSTVRDDVPAALDDVLMKSLAREPSERWCSAEEMIAALEKSHARSRRDALAAIALELPSAVHVVTKGTSAFAPTVDTAAPVLDDRSHGTQIVSRAGVRRSTKRTALVAAGLVAVIGAAFTAVRSSSQSVEPSAPAIDPLSATPASAAPLPSPSALASASAAAPSSSTGAAPSAVIVTTRARTPSRPSATASGVPVPASATRPSCDPPYRIDERGVRVFRTECL